MSKFAIVPNEALLDPELTPSEFRVLVALYSFRNKNADTVFPKLPALATRARVKDKTQISKITTRLESKGWLTKASKTSFHGSKKYCLTIPDRLLLLGADREDEHEEISQVGKSSQVGKKNSGSYPQQREDSPKLVDFPKLDRTASPNLERTTNSQLGKNYQLHKEHTSKNIPENNPEPYGSAAGAAPPVDNFTLPDLGVIYSNPDTETEILNHGVPLLVRSGVEFGKARNFLQMLINKHKPGKVLDALIVCLIEMPVEPRSYLQAVLQKIGDEIPKDWVPPAPCLSELAGMGMPEKIYRDAVDVFVTWFRELGIRHNNFPALFVRWCQRDWERADANTAIYLQRLRASAGFGEVFREPAGGTL